jgi:hypothetical protein
MAREYTLKKHQKFKQNKTGRARHKVAGDTFKKNQAKSNLKLKAEYGVSGGHS